jgi:hypothetical protein
MLSSFYAEVHLEPHPYPVPPLEGEGTSGLLFPLAQSPEPCALSRGGYTTPSFILTTTGSPPRGDQTFSGAGQISRMAASSEAM